MLLRLMGHEVKVVHDGGAALETASAFRPEVGLIDLGLPGLSGYDIARRLREDEHLKDTQPVSTCCAEVKPGSICRAARNAARARMPA